MSVATLLLKSKVLPSSFYNSLTILSYATVTASTKIESKPVKPFNQIPGPKSYPLIGNLLEIKGFGGDLDVLKFGELCGKLQARYGDIVRFQMFDRKQVFVFHPDFTKKVFSVDGELPERNEVTVWKQYFEKKGLPNTLINSNGERWRKLRSASNPIAARPANVALFLEKHDMIAADFLKMIDRKFGNNSSVVIEGFEQQLQLAALELVSVVAFDQRLDCIDEQNRNPDIEHFVKSVDGFMVQLGTLMFSPPIWKYFPTKDWKLFMKYCDDMYTTIRKYVDIAFEAINNRSDQSKNSSMDKTILQQYLLTMDKYKLTLADIIALTSDFLIAGVDTTSTTLHYILYEIGKNKEIQNRLYEEIKQNFNSLDDPVTEARLAKMSFLKAVMKEALRVHSIVPGNGRILQKDLVIDDYLIPKGTSVLMGSMYITKSERFFKNAKTFDPRRWLRTNEKSEEESHPYAHLPFGFGARQCIGRRIAEQEIYTLLTKLVQKYEIDYVGEPFGYRTKIIASPDKPLNVKFTKRT